MHILLVVISSSVGEVVFDLKKYFIFIFDFITMPLEQFQIRKP